VWGCVAFYKSSNPQRIKLGPRGLKSVFVGYAQNSKTYRLLDLETNVIVESIYVEFIEYKFISDSNVQEPNLKVMTPSSMLSEKRKNLEVISSSEPRRSQRVRKEKQIDTNFISTDLIIFLVEGDRNTILKKTFMILNIEDDPKIFGQAMSSRDVAFWKETVNDEMDSILSNNTWILVDLPLGSKPIECKWVFKRKYNTDGSIQTFKARLVAKGFTKNEGVDYFDTYSPVARITSIRVFIYISINL